MHRTIIPSAVLLTFSMQVWPCSVIQYPPVFEMDHTEFTFIGEVVGHSMPVEFEFAKKLSPELPHPDSIKQSSGLIIKVIDKVSLPIDEPEFEVFQYGLGSMCETLGADRAKLQENYPVGTKLIVIAQEAVEVPKISENGLKRLEANISRGLIANADFYLPKVSSTSLYDFGDIYKSKEWHRQSPRMYFEIRKELQRLAEASGREEKEEVLERILEIRHDSYMLDLYRLLIRNSPSSEVGLRRLTRKLKKEGYEQMQIDSYLSCRSKEQKERGMEQFNSICHLKRASDR